MKLPKHRRDEAALNSRLIRRPIKRMVWLFLLPTFGAFCIGFLYPFFKGLFLSFCNFRITSQWTWTGLDNYRKAFQDPGYMHAFWYTALFALVSLLAINLFAFTIAYALTQKFKGTNVFRTVFFLPNLIGGIVLPLIYTNMVTGFESVDKQMLEMARVYGLSKWRTFLYVYRPAFMPFLLSSTKISLGMTWKSGIMAEVLATPKPSIGKEMATARTFLDTPDLLAWTVVVMVASVLFEKAFMALLKRANRPLGGFIGKRGE